MGECVVRGELDPATKEAILGANCQCARLVTGYGWVCGYHLAFDEGAKRVRDERLKAYEGLEGGLRGRTNGTDTSAAAALSQTQNLTRDRKRILSALASNGPMITEQLAAMTKLSPNTCRPRLLDCRELGWVKQDGKGVTVSGRAAKRWAITDAGRERLGRD